MSEWLTYLFLAVGAVLIIKGGDMFVDSASWIAEVSGVPRFIIGATIVSVATTVPELTVSLIASLQGKTDMAVGNAVGSVTVNTAFILATALVFINAKVKRNVFVPKAALLIVAMLLVWTGSMDGVLSMWSVVLLAGILVLYIVLNLHDAKNESVKEGRPAFTRPVLIKNLVFFVLGSAMVVVGSHLLVDSGSDIALRLGVPEGVIAVTLVALGTSLPELVTTLTSVIKKQSALSVGNVVGANILNLVMILPVSSIASGGALEISDASLNLDMPICLGVLLLALIPPIITQRFYKWQGFILLAAYCFYLILLFT